MLKQAGNRELKNTTHNTRKGWLVHLNAFSDNLSETAGLPCSDVVRVLKKVGRNFPFWLTVVDKAFNLFSV